MTAALSLLVLSAVLLQLLPRLSAGHTEVTVDLSLRHPISPMVYGVNFATQTMLDWGVGVTRNSGDAISKYNWKIDMTNSADDWYWMTDTPYMPFQPPTPPNGSFVDGMLQRAVAADSVFINPVNVLGWVVKSRDPCWSFSVKQYGHQQQEKGDAGNGITTNGTYLTSDWHCFSRFDISDNVEWLQHLESMFGKQAMDEHLMIQPVDNEPDCFNPVHRDVHPQQFGYDEMWETVLQFGSVMRALYPNVHLNGPSWSNWCWYWWVRGDGCGGLDGTDFRQHGSVFTNPWLLQKVNQYFLATGVKLLDSLDVHYYPNAIPRSDGTPEEQQAFLDEVRSLYDPTYTDPGNIGQCGARCLGPAVALLPRLRETVKYAPDLDIRFTVSEYAWGFDDDVYTAALAVAEVMAVMGQWNALMSARWIAPAPGSKAEQAYAVFLNYDGRLSKVGGDAAATASSSAPLQTAYSVYNAASSVLFVLLFNRELDAAGNSSAVIQVSNAALQATGGSAATFSMTPLQWQLTQGGNVSVTPTSAGGLSLTLTGLQPRSLTLVVAAGVELAAETAVQWWEPEVQGDWVGLDEMMQRMQEEGPMTADEQAALSRMGDDMRRQKRDRLTAMRGLKHAAAASN